MCFVLKKAESAKHFWIIYIPMTFYIDSRDCFRLVMLLTYLEILSFQQHYTYALKLSAAFPQPDLNLMMRNPVN